MEYKAVPTNVVGVELGTYKLDDDENLIVKTHSMQEWAEELIEEEPDIIVVSVEDAKTNRITEMALGFTDAVAVARDLIIALAVAGDPVAAWLLQSIPSDDDDEFYDLEDDEE